MKFGQKESRLKRGDASSGSPGAQGSRNVLCCEHRHYSTKAERLQEGEVRRS